MKRILLTFLALGLLAGVASADHRRGGRHHDRGRVAGGARLWGGGVSVQPTRVYYNAPRRVYTQPRRVYVERTRVVRQPIYVQRPVMRYRYYNYYQRPAVFVENYPARDGYYWVAGQWSWSGAEWIWYPGHYEPDPNYVDYGSYNSGASVNIGVGYDSGYSEPCDHDGDYGNY